MPQIHRVTMFKVEDKEHVAAMLEAYKTLNKTAVKDGKPYVISLHAGAVEPQERDQGYTLTAKSVFASKADMEYYETECEAHKQFKAFSRGSGKVAGILTVYFEDVINV